jgi:hypothetical protein
MVSIVWHPEGAVCLPQRRRPRSETLFVLEKVNEIQPVRPFVETEHSIRSQHSGIDKGVWVGGGRGVTLPALAIGWEWDGPNRALPPPL